MPVRRLSCCRPDVLSARKAFGVNVALRAYLCAAFSFLVIASSVLFGFPSSVAIVLSSALAAGGVLFSRSPTYTYIYSGHVLLRWWPLVASLAWRSCFFLALIVFLKDVNVLCGCAIMADFLRGWVFARRGKGVDSAPGLNDEGATPSEPSSEGGSRVLLPGGIRPASFRALFFVGGFFLSYEFNGTQKTAHFVGTHVFSEQIGGTALASVSYLVLMLVLMVIVVGAYLRPGVSLPGIAFVVLLAVTFFSLPARTPFPFPLLAAGASILFFVTCFACVQGARRDAILLRCAAPLLLDDARLVFRGPLRGLACVFRSLEHGDGVLPTSSSAFFRRSWF